MVNGHRDTCRWRDNPCPASYSVFPPASDQQLLRGLSQRIETFKSAGTPELQLASKSRICSRLDRAGNSEILPWTRFAAAGWEVPLSRGTIVDHDAPTGAETRLWCRMCNRQLGIWNFVRKDEDGAGPAASSSRDGSSPTGSAEEAARHLKAFDPIREHRWFCPWVCAEAASSLSTGSSPPHFQAGWERVVDAFLASTTARSGNASTARGSHEQVVADHASVVQKSQQALAMLQGTFAS